MTQARLQQLPGLENVTFKFQDFLRSLRTLCNVPNNTL